MFLLPQTPYLIPNTTWDAVMTAPNVTVTDHLRAWQPVADAIEKILQGLPANVSAERLQLSMGLLGPSGYEMGPDRGVNVLACPIQGRPHSAFMSIILSKRFGNDMRTRHADLIVTPGAAMAVTPWMPASAKPVQAGQAMGNGSTVRIGGSAWTAKIFASHGQIAAVNFRLDHGRWAPVAKLLSDDTGEAWPDPSPMNREGYRVKVQHKDGAFVSIAYDNEAFTYDEVWRRRGATFVPVDRVQEPNEFWAMDGLVAALRKGDRKAARAFVVKQAVIDQALAAHLDASVTRWYANGEGDGKSTGYQLNGNDDQKVWHSVSVRFQKVGNETRIRSITAYR